VAAMSCKVCGAPLADPAPAQCAECGAPVPGRRTVAQPADTVNEPFPSRAAPPTRSVPGPAPAGAAPACDHRAAPAGAVICPECGHPVPARSTSTPAAAPAPAPRRVVLTFPWGDIAMAPGETLEIGREVGPLQRHLEAFATVGRRHATLRLTLGGQLLIRDHTSTNGTFVDARRCSPAADREVPDGAELRFSQRLAVGVRFTP